MGYTKLIKSGDMIELYEYDKFLHERRKKSKKGLRGNRGCSVRRLDNVKRLKRDFVRLVRSNLTGTECPLFLTLTMGQVLRIEIAYRLFASFIHRFRRLNGTHWRYIAVPEFQKRGAVHFHVLIWGLSEKIEINERNTRAIQHVWQRGFVDCFLTDGSPKLAHYVAKYMSKALQDERLFYSKAYVCSRNCLRPLLFKTSSVIRAVSELWGFDLSTATPLREKEYDTKWLGRGRYRVYKTQ